MVISCSAQNCTNRQTSNGSITFHRFPVKDERRKLWISAINRINFIPSRFSFICSDHFKPSDFKPRDEQKKRSKRAFLKPNAVPFGKSLAEERMEIKKTPLKLKKKEKVKKLKQEKLKKEPATPAQLELKRRIKTFKQTLKRRREKLLVSL